LRCFVNLIAALEVLITCFEFCHRCCLRAYLRLLPYEILFP